MRPKETMDLLSNFGKTGETANPQCGHSSQQNNPDHNNPGNRIVPQIPVSHVPGVQQSNPNFHNNHPNTGLEDLERLESYQLFLKYYSQYRNPPHYVAHPGAQKSSSKN